MKRFRFRLEKLLKIKEYNELNSKLKYANIVQEKAKIERENLELEENIFSGKISNPEMEAFFSDLFLKKIKINNERLNNLKEELSKRFEEYKNARKEKKMLECLKTKEYTHYKKELNRYNTKQLDDISSQMYIRNNLLNK